MIQEENIYKILHDLDIKYDLIEHEETTSCEHSSILRTQAGLDGAGSKNIVFHAKGLFYLLTTLGTKEIKARKFKAEFGTKDIRFASGDEISNIGVGIIGSIAPFGFLNKDISVYVDREIFENEFFIFNPANPCKTIRLKTSDLKRVYENMENKVKFFEISEEGGGDKRGIRFLKI